MRTEVDTVMKAWQDAWFVKNGRAIATMMSDDYIYVAPNGTVMDRSIILGVVEDPTYALTGGAHTETVVTMLGESAAMVRRRWKGSGTYQGQEFVEDHRCVTICDLQVVGGTFDTSSVRQWRRESGSHQLFQ